MDRGERYHRRGDRRERDEPRGHRSRYDREEQRDGRERYQERYRDSRRESDVGRGEQRREAPQLQELPELYSICRGKVHSIKPFGFFVRLDGYRAHGLVHLSQVSNHEVTQREDSDEVKMRALGAIFTQGDDVWVKIISVKREEDGSVKVGCSLKLVAQSDGRDLDPNNLQVDLQDTRPGHVPRNKVTLDAVYNVECTRCGGHGHLKSECYSTGEKVYELLPEENNDEQVQEARKQEPESRVAETNDGTAHGNFKKRKQLPDSVSTVEEAKALIASLKKEKKKKRERKEDRHGDKKHHKKKKKEKRESR